MATRSLFRRRAIGLWALAALACAPGQLRAQSPNSNSQSSTVPGTVFTPSFQLSAGSKPDVLTTTARYRLLNDTGGISSPVSSAQAFVSEPEIDWRYTRARPGQLWTLSYRLGGRLYRPGFSELDSISNDVQVQARQILGPRLTLLATGHWADVPGVGFKDSSSNNLLQTFPMVTSEDESVALLVDKRRAAEGGFSLRYRTGARTYLAWGANYSKLSYTPTKVLSSQSSNAFLALDHQLTNRLLVSVGYSSRWLWFPGQDSRTRVDEVLGTYSNQLSPTLSLSVFAGPAWVHQALGARFFGIPVALRGTDTQAQGGVRLNKTLRQSILEAHYTRMYLRGAFSSAPVLRQEVGASFSRSLTRRISMEGSGNYSKGSLAGILGSSYPSYRVEPSFHYRLGPRVSLLIADTYAGIGGQTTLGRLHRNALIAGIEFKLPDFAVEK